MLKMNKVKILIIGNGFDLAHGLPTKYGHFLEFCEKVCIIYKSNHGYSVTNFEDDHLRGWDFNSELKSKLKCAYESIVRNSNPDKVHTGNPYLDELYYSINNNLWFELFLKAYRDKKLKGENWIDFESEIASVIYMVEQRHHEIINPQATNLFIDTPINNIIKELDLIIKKSKTAANLKDMKDYINQLSEDLDRITRALEIYLSVFINQIQTGYKELGLNFNAFNYVLSFNYTNTYERLYNACDTKYCYIHGKADKEHNTKTCNLVLGIDEYLNDEEKNRKLACLSFKKFYQRIYKGTDDSYFDWLKPKIDAYGQKIIYELHIFGHSLDITDKDILKRFILDKNVETYIYYYRENEYDKKEMANKIRNLIRIIGQDKLLKKTSGPDKTIKFIPQPVQIN